MSSSNFIVISKKNCQRCRIIKEWLESVQFPYEEWALDDSGIQNKVLQMENIHKTATVHENGKFRIITPILYNNETGKIYSKQLFGLNGIRKHFLEMILSLKPSSPSEKVEWG